MSLNQLTGCEARQWKYRRKQTHYIVITRLLLVCMSLCFHN